MKLSKRQLKRQPSKQFGAYLKRLREERTELSQADAARKLGLRNRQQLNYYEKGTRMPPDSLLMNIAHIYHVATGEILERAYWPQLILLPLIAIINPEQLPKDLIEELEKGLKEEERRKITQYIEKLLLRRDKAKQHTAV